MYTYNINNDVYRSLGILLFIIHGMCVAPRHLIHILQAGIGVQINFFVYNFTCCFIISVKPIFSFFFLFQTLLLCFYNFNFDFYYLLLIIY